MSPEVVAVCVSKQGCAGVSPEVVAVCVSKQGCAGVLPEGVAVCVNKQGCAGVTSKDVEALSMVCRPANRSGCTLSFRASKLILL